MPLLSVLALPGAALSGTVPLEYARLTALQEVVLTGCGRLSGTVPHVFYNATGLQVFGFYDNPLISGVIGDDMLPWSELTGLAAFAVGVMPMVSGTLPAALSHLQSLQVLSVFDLPLLSGPLPASLSTTTTSIRFSDLPRVASEFPVSYNTLPQLTTLQIGNIPSLSGTISQIGNSAMQNLAIYSAQVSGTLPCAWDNTPYLQAMSLYQLPRLSGTWCASLSSLPSLKDLRLHHTRVSGTLPDSIGQLQSLTALFAMSNELSGTLPDTVTSLSNLAQLDLDSNPMSGTIPERIGLLSQLTALYLYVMPISGTIPDSITTLRKLEQIHIFSLRVTGTLPADFSPLQHLWTLNINSLAISGTLPPSSFMLSSLKTYIVHTVDRLSGTIPQTIGSTPNLNMLAIFTTALSGSIPDAVCKYRFMQRLYLQFNYHISGTLPSCIGDFQHLTHVGIFDMPTVSGTLPRSFGNWTNLEHISLFNMRVSGTIPDDLDKLSNTIRFDVYAMSISGTIPSTLSAMHSLRVLTLSRLLQLSGTFPRDVVHMPNLHSLEISVMSHLSGTLPPLTGALAPLSFIALDDLDMVSGSVPDGIFSLPNLTHLSMHGTNLSGTLPQINVNASTTINVLSLSNTGLSGPVPSWVCQLHGLTNFDVSLNRLTAFPNCTLSNVVRLDASFNYLTALPSEILAGPALTFAGLAHNNIVFDENSCISAQSGISALDLAFNPLGSEFLPTLACYLTPGISTLIMSHSLLSGEMDTEIETDHQGTVYYAVSEFSRVLYNIGNGEPLRLAHLDLSNTFVSGSFGFTQVVYPPFDTPKPTPASTFGYIPLFRELHIDHSHISVTQLNIDMVSLTMSFAGQLSFCAIQNILSSPSLREFAAYGQELGVSGVCNSEVINSSNLVAVSKRRVINESNVLECPVWEAIESNTLIKVDSSFNDYYGCSCPDGSYAEVTDQVVCNSCEGRPMVCSAQVQSPIHHVLGGWYPVSAAYCAAQVGTDPAAVSRRMQCLITATTFVRCRVQGVCAVEPEAADARSRLFTGYSCSQGHDAQSTLCSKCLDGYFPISGVCYSCSSFGSVLGPTMLFLGFFLYCWFMWYQYVHVSTVSTFSIAVFFLQTVAVAERGQRPLSVQGFMSDLSFFQPMVFECLFPGMQEAQLEIALLAPMIFGVAVATVLAMAYSVMSRYREIKFRRRRLITFSVSYTLDLLYLPTFVAVCTALNCFSVDVPASPSDPTSVTISFLNEVPWRQCHGVGTSFLAALVLVVYIVAWPVMGTYRLFTHMHKRFDPDYPLFFLVSSCKPEAWWWQPAVVRARAVLLALFQYALPYDDTVSSLLIFLVLLVHILLDVRIQPYKHMMDNVLSTLTVASTLVIFLSAILVSGGETDTGSARRSFNQWVFVLTLAACVGCIARIHLASRVRVLWARVNKQPLASDGDQQTSLATSLLAGTHDSDVTP